LRLTLAQNSGTIRATRPIGRGTLWSRAGPRIDDLRFTIYDLKAEGRDRKPISGGARWDGAAGAWDARQMCKTNPICDSPRGRQSWAGCPCHCTAGRDGAGGARAGPAGSGTPSFQDSIAVPAPAGERCKTNPIWPSLGRAGSRQAKHAKRTQFLDCGLRTDLRRDACPAVYCLRPAWVERAKRTQFGPAWAALGPGGRKMQNEPILLRAAGKGRGWPRTQLLSPPGIIAPNEANLSRSNARPSGRCEGAGSPPQAGRTVFPGNPQLSLDFVSPNLYVFLFPERGEGTALLRLQIGTVPGAVSLPLICDPPCAIHNTGCDSGGEIR